MADSIVICESRNDRRAQVVPSRLVVAITAIITILVGVSQGIAYAVLVGCIGVVALSCMLFIRFGPAKVEYNITRGVVRFEDIRFRTRYFSLVGKRRTVEMPVQSIRRISGRAIGVWGREAILTIRTDQGTVYLGTDFSNLDTLFSVLRPMTFQFTCFRCGYDLSGAAGKACPECGLPRPGPFVTELPGKGDEAAA